MSTQRPLPEAVRGAWYYIPRPFDAEQAQQPPYKVLSFTVDGAFRRYDIKGKQRKLAENGEYTFDGNFLIIRGRRTNTFRVQRPSFWHWNLEGKKKDFALVRAFADQNEIEELPSQEARDIRILPLRAVVEADFKGDDIIHRLVYEHGEKDRRLLASFFVERHDKNHLWVGINPLVSGIEPKTWERIIGDSYIDMFLGKPTDIDHVTMHLFDSERTLSFDR